MTALTVKNQPGFGVRLRRRLYRPLPGLWRSVSLWGPPSLRKSQLLAPASQRVSERGRALAFMELEVCGAGREMRAGITESHASSNSRPAQPGPSWTSGCRCERPGPVATQLSRARHARGKRSPGPRPGEFSQGVVFFWGGEGFGPQTNSLPTCPSPASSPSPLSHSAGQSQASNLWRPQLEEGRRKRKSKDYGFILTHFKLVDIWILAENLNGTQFL